MGTDEDRADLKKAGPRDFGKNRYKGLKFDDAYILKLRAKNQAKKEEEKRKALEEEKRLRAEYDVRNISRPQNWKGMKYDDNEAEIQRAERKRKILERKREALQKKAGPRDITKSRYKGLKYSEEEQERIRAQKREEEEQRKREEAAPDLAKLGPRDMGKMKYK